MIKHGHPLSTYVRNKKLSVKSLFRDIVAFILLLVFFIFFIVFFIFFIYFVACIFYFFIVFFIFLLYFLFFYCIFIFLLYFLFFYCIFYFFIVFFILFIYFVGCFFFRIRAESCPDATGVLPPSHREALPSRLFLPHCGPLQDFRKRQTQLQKENFFCPVENSSS